jgi:flagellar hook protein FlgE
MAAERRFTESATRVARMAGDDNVDYAAEAVAQVSARQAFSANVQVVKVADQMWQALLDLQTR